MYFELTAFLKTIILFINHKWEFQIILLESLCQSKANEGKLITAKFNSGSLTEVTYFGNRKIVKFAQMSYFWWGISWYGRNLHISANCWEKRNYVNFWLSPRFSPKMENQVWLTPWMVLKKTNDLTRIGQACWFQK